MSRLHVCVDFVILPFGSEMLIGFLATCKFVTDAPSTRKWPVGPGSEMAYSTALIILGVLKIISAFLICMRLLACTYFCHGPCLVPPCTKMVG